MNPYFEMIIQLAATMIIQSVKNPASMARLKPVLYKIAAVIYAAAEQLGEAQQLDAKIDAEIAKAGTGA